jgi:hypothetical protein
MSLKASLVFTTINDPVLLEDSYRNFSKYGHLDNIKVIIIPDKKTPPAIFDRCRDLESRGLQVSCPAIEEQETFLNRIGFPGHMIPYNSDNRRNIGYLMALKNGSDFIISIDDDNYCKNDEDFFTSHSIVCSDDVEQTVVGSDSRWYNICDMMELDRPSRTYARGFPYYARHKSELINESKTKVDIHVNAGLWLKDPDVDGISWLVNPVHTVDFKGSSVVLGKNTWSPVNTQNTALRRDAIASYYFVKMGYQLSGISIDRYGDIFSGFFSQACVRHMGGAIRFGTPLADHKRNSHNYINDASNEMACIVVLEDLLPWMTDDLKLCGNTYPDTYISLSHAIEDKVEKFKGRIWTDEAFAYFHQMAFYMRKWAQVCKNLL